MYARGMTCREIKAHLEEIYGVEVSPDNISTVTDAVIDEVRLWQQRPLDPLYPILYLDALQVKVKDQGRVSNKANNHRHRRQHIRNQGSSRYVDIGKRRREVLALGHHGVEDARSQR